MQNQVTLRRSLGAKDAFALLIGTVIGTGIFLKAAMMSQLLAASGWVLLAWVVAGLLSLVGALTYAELGARFPRAGGEYVYLREAYGGLIAFLCGWTRFWIGSPASIAAFAVGAATFLQVIVPFDHPFAVKGMAIAFILFSIIVNCASVAVAGRLQTMFTALKVVFIVVFAGLLLFAGNAGSLENLASSWTGPWPGWGAFSTAVISALWAYQGWSAMPMVAGEIKNAQFVVPRVLVFGMLAILFLYCVINLAYFYVLPFSVVAESFSRQYPAAAPVATRAAELVWGQSASWVLSSVFVFSTLGALLSYSLASARMPYAMAQDGIFFRSLSRLSTERRAPYVAVCVQGFAAVLLALTGTFDQLTTYVVFSAWFFYLLCAIALFLLRKRSPEVSLSFKTPLYPWLPTVFIASTIFLLAQSLAKSPGECMIGLALILAGVPVYAIFQARKNREMSPTKIGPLLRWFNCWRSFKADRPIG